MNIKTVVITRPIGAYGGAAELSAAVESMGISPFILPVLRCEPIKLTSEMELVVRRLLEQRDTWIAFLSPTAVQVFRDICGDRQTLFQSIKIAVQGTGTLEAVKSCFGRGADFTPSHFVAEVFAEEFAQSFGEELKGAGSVLVPQSADGRDVLGPALRAHGISVQSVSTFRTLKLDLAEGIVSQFKALDVDSTVVVFMSPSAVRATVTGLASCEQHLRQLRVLSVGPITSQAVRETGLSVAFEATEHSVAGVLEALRLDKPRGVG
jgi:uroporphyrinogen-III synthase